MSSASSSASRLRAPLVALTLCCLLHRHGASAADTPWTLGDETTVACYTLAKQDIPRPVGLTLRWTPAPPPQLGSTSITVLKYTLSLTDGFWSDPTNAALLGADYARYFRLCLNETGGCDSTGDCCVWHANLHACRSEAGACEPWVTPTNATGSDGQNYTLVTATPQLTGGLQEYDSPIQLNVGDWYVLAHMKLLTFQCAVGAARRSVAPPASSNSAPIALGVTIPLLLVLGVTMSLIAWRRSKSASRDLSCAPTSGAVALIFTDIQDSTNLWSKFTESMAAALDTHHAVIRRCIAAHGGYEVKTVGDAFMIAVRDVPAATAIAVDIQRELMRERWPRCITRHYLGEELEDKPEELEAAEPGALYHGVRVRVGLHVGKPDCVFDEVSKGYDYYGNDVNLAARVEAAACGGQILATAEVEREWAADRSKFPDVAMSLHGSILPKGLSEMQAVFNVVSTHLPCRVYQQIAFQKPGARDDEVASRSSAGSIASRNVANSRLEEVTLQRLTDALGGGSESGAAEVAAHFENRKAFLLLLLKPLSKNKASQVLETLTEGWRATVRTDRKEDRVVALCGRVIPAEWKTANPLPGVMSREESETFPTPTGSPGLPGSAPPMGFDLHSADSKQSR